MEIKWRLIFVILEKIKGIISGQFDIDEEDITLDTSFKDDLSADSLDLVELIMALEDEFDLEVEDDEVESIKTVGDAVDYIKNILGED
ncbi:acyl carrier protein [Tissierella sp. MSJ-40]|jgi:acyl carrier protein|uniref:Acyl carrier protein n=1 Tax=Tissierella simiarum TaxID=2841534 RepID=A0ABS6E684_9FIRM|nr:acyl carrier protein [Tissierella simiarum]MBU5437738.1 acyl carrier protein [Tissierella simiarum]